MKKILPAAAIAACTMMIACKKEYTCTCVTRVGYTTTDSTVTTFKETNRNALQVCASQNITTDTSTKLCYLPF